MSDIACEDDMDLFGSDTKSELQEIQQDAWHTMIDEPGDNLDDLDAGLGLEDELSKDAATLNGVEARTEVALAVDDRIAGVKATLTKDVEEETYTLDVQIQPVAGVEGTVNITATGNGLGGQS